MKKIYTENSMILEASLTNLFNHMQVHTKFVQAFREDFNVDKDFIKAAPHHTFLWMVRRNGTQLVDLTEVHTSSDLKNTALYWHWENTREKQVYLVSLSGVKRLYTKSVDKLFQEGYKA